MVANGWLYYYISLKMGVLVPLKMHRTWVPWGPGGLLWLLWGENGVLLRHLLQVLRPLRGRRSCVFKIPGAASMPPEAASMPPKGAVEAAFGRPRGAHGAVLGAQGAPMERTWAPKGRRWSALRRPRGAHGAHLGAQVDFFGRPKRLHLHSGIGSYQLIYKLYLYIS